MFSYRLFDVHFLIPPKVWNICKERGWVRPTIYQAMYNAISKFSGTLFLFLDSRNL